MARGLSSERGLMLQDERDSLHMAVVLALDNATRPEGDCSGRREASRALRPSSVFMQPSQPGRGPIRIAAETLKLQWSQEAGTPSQRAPLTCPAISRCLLRAGERAGCSRILRAHKYAASTILRSFASCMKWHTSQHQSSASKPICRIIYHLAISP